MKLNELQVEVRDSNLVRVGQIAAKFLDVEAVIKYCGVGYWKITLPSEHDMVPVLRAPGSGVIIRLRGEVFLSGPTTSIHRSASPEDPSGSWVISGVDDNILLQDGRAWPTPTNPSIAAQGNFDERTGITETLMRGYVRSNIGDLAPAARRGKLAQRLTFPPDLSRGPVVTKQARFPTLGELLTELALYANLDYKIRQVGTTLEFRVISLRDQSPFVRFSVRNGSLSEEELTLSPPTLTRAIVGGEGEGDVRTMVQVTSPESLVAEDAWGRKIESWVDERSSSTPDELAVKGMEQLIEGGKTSLAVKAVPTDDILMTYRVDWELGDTVSVIIENQETKAQITEVALVANKSGVMLGASIGDVSGFSPASAMGRQGDSTSKRVEKLERTVEVATQFDASAIVSGKLDPARMAHINSDSTTRAWFTTDPSGGWGGAHTTLSMSPPTDATWTNALDLRVNNLTKFAISKDGVLTAGTVPADRIDKFTSAANYTNLLGTAGSVTQGWVFQLNDGAGTAGLIHNNAWKVQWNTAGDMLVGRVPTARLTGYVGYANLPHIVSNPAASPPYMILGVDQSVSYDTNTTALRLQNRSGATTGERFAIFDAARKVLIFANTDTAGDYIAMLAAYTRTTTLAANLVAFTTSGAIGRSTSLRAAKVSIEDAPESWADKVWSLQPRTWFDKGDADLVAEALNRADDGEDVEWSEVVASPLRRIPGFVAEEVEEAGLEEFLVRDQTGELTGLAYDRFSAALLVAMKDERQKRIEAELRINELESKLSALADHLGVEL